MNKFPFEKVIKNGKEFILMKSDTFHSFFNEIAKYGGINKSLVNEVNKRYNKAKKTKKKRIRMKKEKEVLIAMCSIMFLLTKNNEGKKRRINNAHISS